MKVSDFERDVLVALRDPEFWLKCGRVFTAAEALSPAGKRVAAIFRWVHEHRKSRLGGLITWAEVQTAIKRESNLPAAVADLAKDVCADPGDRLTLQTGLAEEVSRRAALHAMMEQALAQQQSGQVNLEALANALRTFRGGAAMVRDFCAATVAKEENGLEPLPTPWKAINQEIDGGLRPKELGMILAQPKVGKTRALLNMAANALAAGWSVLYVTAADISYSGISLRLAGIWLNEDPAILRRNPERLVALERVFKKRGVRMAVADYTTKPCGMLDIERDVELFRAQQGEKPVAVFVDRLETAISTDRSGESRREITANYQTARMIAARYVVPVWVDSQASLYDGDQGWVNLTRGAEARIGKAATVDLSLGMGVHPDNENVIRVTLAGRRSITRRAFELDANPKTGRMTG